MTYEVDVQNDADYPVDLESLVRAAEIVLREHNVEDDSAMSVVITDDKSVAALNLQFRGVDAPTDVLSFPMDAPPMPRELPYLGDLVIGYPYSAAQAEREAYDIRDGLMLEVVHGTLHLLGYDHDTDENRAVMWAAQDKALIALGVPTSIVPRLEDDEASHE